VGAADRAAFAVVLIEFFQDLGDQQAIAYAWC
jgi:hypothetical protein